MENQYLLWIKLMDPFVSISALEQYIGIPHQTLHKYLRTGDFPEKHLPQVEKVLEPIVHFRPNWVNQYANQLLKERKQLLPKVKVGNPQDTEHIRMNARQEQILDDLARLYLVLRSENALLAADIYFVLMEASPLMREIVQFLDDKGEPLSLEKVRELSHNASEKTARHEKEEL